MRSEVILLNESAILAARRGNWEFSLLSKQKKFNLAKRFRGLLPVVIDVETSGLEVGSNALLELAAVTLSLDSMGKIFPQQTFSYFIEPFPGAVLDTDALVITGIDPFQPLRYAIPERQALERLFAHIREQLAATGCVRAVLVGHNAWFDLAFILAAIKRNGIIDAPIHSFTTFDTATLSAVALGETVLARSVREAGFEFDVSKAHSAVYDAQRTADLFCYIVNNVGV
ncbi:MAG: exonuclease domain-containing protein [Pseudomonadota bacterium]